MKKLFLIISMLSLFSCQYDDMWIKDEFAELDKRIEKLENLCESLNADIQSIHKLIDAIKENEFISEVIPITQEGTPGGYRIVFESGKEISIYNGKEGQQGDAGYIPSISVKQDTDGEWYWTVDGEWMLDSNGNKVSTTGRTDLIPVLKIVEFFWYISYDNGKTWTKLEKAVGEDGRSYFSEITHDNENVYLTLADGNTITIPKVTPFELELDIDDEIVCTPYQTITIAYTLLGAGENAEIFTLSEGSWRDEVIADSETNGKIVIHAPEKISEGQVIVMASNQKKNIIKSLKFVEGTFLSTDSFLLSAEGGELAINLTTNYSYDITVDASWITYVETRSLREEEVIFYYDSLPEGISTRSATITFTDRLCGIVKTVEIVQGCPILLNRQQLTMVVDEEEYLTAEVLLPSQDLVWISSDSNIAWVSQEGKVIALSEGTATITAMTADYRHAATCRIDVIDLSDYIYLEQGGASNVSYSDGYVHAGTKLSWYFYNTSKENDFVKYLQIVDSYGTNSNQMWVEETIYAGEYTGWTITLGTSYKAPGLKIVYEYKGKEYSHICGHMFN